MILGILVLSGYVVNEITNEDSNIIEDENNIVIDKENNICEIDSDCEYIWYTGECNTPEYAAKKQKEAQEQGMNIGEAPPREGVTCTCENNKCITHG